MMLFPSVSRKEGLQTVSQLLELISSDTFMESVKNKDLQVDFVECARFITDLLTEGQYEVIRKPLYDETAEPKE